MQVALGFVKVQLEVVAIGIKNIAAFVWARTASLNTCSSYIYIKSRLAVTGGRNSNGTPAKALSLYGSFTQIHSSNATFVH